MDDQQRIIELLTELRDLQKAHFEHYRQFTQQVAEDSRREHLAAQQFREQFQGKQRRDRTAGIVAGAVTIVILLFYLALVLLELFRAEN